MLYQNLKIPVNSRQSHSLSAFYQLSMQLLTSQFILAFIKFFKKLFLSFGNVRLSYHCFRNLFLSRIFDHTESFE